MSANIFLAHRGTETYGFHAYIVFDLDGNENTIDDQLILNGYPQYAPHETFNIFGHIVLEDGFSNFDQVNSSGEIIIPKSLDALDVDENNNPTDLATRNYTLLNIPQGETAETLWEDMVSFTRSLAGDASAITGSGRFITDWDYKLSGPNSNSVVNSILNSVGINFENVVPPASPNFDFLPYIARNHTLDGSGNDVFTAFNSRNMTFHDNAGADYFIIQNGSTAVITKDDNLGEWNNIVLSNYSLSNLNDLYFASNFTGDFYVVDRSGQSSSNVVTIEDHMLDADFNSRYLFVVTDNIDGRQASFESGVNVGGDVDIQADTILNTTTLTKIDTRLIDFDFRFLLNGKSLNEIETVQEGQLNFTGSSVGQLIFGNDSDNVINGGGGNDILIGGGGNDTLNGGSGNDTFYDQGGFDIFNGGSGNDLYYLNASNGNIIQDTGISGVDTAYFINDYSFSIGSNSALVSGGIEYVRAADGTNFEIDGFNVVELEEPVEGEPAPDTLVGTSGQDYLSNAHNGATTLNGGDGNDYFLGVAGTTYIAGLGHDVINHTGGEGFLDLQGGGHTYVRAANGSLVLSAGSNSVTIQQYFSGNGGNLKLAGTQTLLSDFLDGNVGYYQLQDVAQNYTGGDENNVYLAVTSGDHVFSGSGANTYKFNTNDFEGEVTIAGAIDSQTDVIEINGASLNDVELIFEHGVLGALHFDNTKVIVSNLLVNGAPNQYLIETDSGSSLIGNLDHVIEASLAGASGDISGFSIDDKIFGSSFIQQTLNGLTGDDFIDGRGGVDIIYGGTGDDTLDGGSGNDTLYGGAGSDTFIDSAGDDIYFVDNDDVLEVGDGINIIQTDESGLGGFKIDLTAHGSVDENGALIETGFYRDFAGDKQSSDYWISYGGGSVVIDDYNDLIALPSVLLTGGTLASISGSNYLGIGSSGVDVYVEKSSIHTVIDDMVYASGGDDRFTFRHGEDTVYGGDGNDSLGKTSALVSGEDGTGTLTAYGENGDDSLTGGLGDDYLDGGDGDDLIIDFIGGQNTLLGGLGNDTFFVNAFGNSTVNGGNGIDTVGLIQTNFYAGTSLSFVVDLAAETISASGMIDHILVNVENAIGSDEDDTLVGTAQSNYLDGWSGSDALLGGDGNDTYAFGGVQDFLGDIQNFGNDSVADTQGIDSIILLDVYNISDVTLTFTGDDLTIGTNNGSVFVNGQLLQSSQIENLILGDESTFDLINYQSWYGVNTADPDPMPSENVIIGTLAAEVITGTAGVVDEVDYSASSAAVDVQLQLSSAAGGDAQGDSYISIENVTGSNLVGLGDELQGDANANILSALSGDDIVYGGGGNDLVLGGNGNDFVDGESGDDIVEGGAGNDDVFGGSGDDVLRGGIGDDTLKGGGDDDTLYGGVGDDTLYGGIGYDTAVFSGEFVNYTIEAELAFPSYPEYGFSGNMIVTDTVGTDGIDIVSEYTERYLFADGTYENDQFTAFSDPNYIVFASTGFSSYAGTQDQNPGQVISADGKEFTLSGNSWRAADFDYTVTESTVLEFTFSSSDQAEIHTIGLDADTDFLNTNGVMFQLYGTQLTSLAEWDYRGYETGEGTVTYRIRVGDHITGDMNYLTFGNDNDANPNDGQSIFGNIRVYEEEHDFIFFNEAEIKSYHGNSSGDFKMDVSNDGVDVTFSGDAWQRLSYDYTVTENTVLEFDFSSDNEGGVHAIGVDDDTYFSNGETTFLLHGSSLNGFFTHDFNSYDGNGENHFAIRLGDYYTGDINNLTFINSTYGTDSTYRNLRLYEADHDYFLLNEGQFSGYHAHNSIAQTRDISVDNFEVSFTTPTWQKLNHDHTITSNTVLEFDFSSANTGEIHAIGFDTDTYFSNGEITFLLDGSSGSTLFNRDYEGYTGNGTKEHFSIRLGDYYTQDTDIDYVTFLNSASGADSTYSNIRLYETSGELVLSGDNANDILTGGLLDDTLVGRGGADTLDGGDGNDILYGQDGLDTLIGGLGADTFVFEAGTAFNDTDVISDFDVSENDALDLSALLSGYDAVQDAITDFIEITDDGTDSFVAVDVDGGADNFVQIATLSGVTGITDEANLVIADNLIVA